ncbi:MAG TPA: alkaline phosphatase family protein [Anaerolineae bacterium]|nr:alkaline phosphatase family protein [Anaerolineae bacterium]
MSRVIIIGWDGATWDLLKPWAAAGHLPAVAQLLKQGYHAPLRSTIQPLTAVAWSSFLTGALPGQHGLYDFVRRVPNSYNLQLTGRHHRQLPGLWQLLSQHNKRVAAVNVPMMVPVTPVNGILVGGIDAPGLNEQTVYPPEFIPQLKQTVPDYRIAASERTLSAWEKSLRAMVNGRSQLLHHLRQQEDWDCLMVVYSATDIVQHIFWGHMARQEEPYANLIRDIYQACDRDLGHLLNNINDNTTLILMSDHGAGPLTGALYINRYLEQGGFLQRQTPPPHLQASRHLLKTAKKYLPAAARAWLRHRFGNVRDNLESNLLTAAYNWPQTEVYSLGSYGNLFVNLIGRDPQGTVSPDQLPQLQQRLEQHLSQLKDPNHGAPLVKKLWPRQQLYTGPATDTAPDFIIEWADYGYEVRARFGQDGDHYFAPTMPLNDLAPETVLAGTHRMDGVLAALGRGVHPQTDDTPPHITTLAPTIMHLLGLPIPPQMSSPPLPALSHNLPQPRYLTTDDHNTPHNETGLEADDEALILDRLRQLGYLG